MEDYSERLPSRLAARLVMALTAEDIADCYTWGKEKAGTEDRSLSLFLFCILSTLCLEYIYQKHLTETDVEFQRIIAHLSRLTGLFHWNDKCLSYTGTLKILTGNGEIPADIDLDHSDQDHPKYVMMSRFIDVLTVAYDILEDYESTIPSSNIENLTLEEIDSLSKCKQPGLDNVLESARRTVINIAQLRAVGKAMRERWLHGTQPIRRDENEFPFEL
jgi:hypothetical protein